MIKKSIPSDLKNIVPALVVFKQDLIAHKIDDIVIFEIVLSVEEALVNAVKFGNKSDSSLVVDFEYLIADNEVIVKVKDQGSGFDFAHLPDPTIEENITKVNGRGVYLLTQLMDSVEYLENGSCVCMRKVFKREEE